MPLVSTQDVGQLVTASDSGAVRLWNLTAHKVTGKIHTSDGPTLSVAFSPDGTLLATAGKDGTLRFWDATSHTPIGDPVTGHTGPVRAAASSPAGRLLATVGEDPSVRLREEAASVRPGKTNAPMALGGADPFVRLRYEDSLVQPREPETPDSTPPPQPPATPPLAVRTMLHRRLHAGHLLELGGLQHDSHVHTVAFATDVLAIGSETETAPDMPSAKSASGQQESA
ncbi:WD40 repeat domain-containing protein [Streptomyces sp. AN091965]|uniref:WD40 repeat domain-containing protein n=1 Tax=Streptomyces sp. AN091965 TaxID=2927803 RepID=UPI001F61003D|nr:hypothetical protein [Streptomyces sp. AN091965]MCI3934516.1 hypothetical protein [Streptomyces sp. AN091965]